MNCGAESSACRLVGLEDYNVCPGLGLDGHALDSYHVRLRLYGKYLSDLLMI